MYKSVVPSGHKLSAYWNLLEEEFKPKASKIISVVMELWSKQSTQNSLPLNEWITKVYNIVEQCHYGTASKIELS